MKISYDLPKLKRMLEDIYRLSGVSICFLDAEGRSLVNCRREDDFCSALQREQKEKCARCDKALLERCAKSLELEHHLCHAGLYDSAMPILKDGAVVGFLLMGRVRAERSPQREDPLYRKLPLLKEEQLLALYDLLPHILFSNGIRVERDPLMEGIAAYIKENLREEIRVEALCARFHLSKNSLYRGFRTHFSCAVNEYILEQRILKAKKLLGETALPIGEIAEQVGMDPAYFSRLFKKQEGCSPVAYRKR